jgi:hypothetical protein
METTSKTHIEEKHTELLNSLGCFWAFNNDQFKEGAEKAGGIENTGKYIACGHGLYCPKKNIEALINGMDEIRKNWDKDRKQGEQVKLIYKGIDSFNRPIWKAPDIKAYFGSVTELFSYGATEEEVLKKVTTFDLCYFGDHFDCEPMGSSIPDKYYI